MKTLDEIKEDVSKDFGFRSWYALGEKTQFFKQALDESTNEEISNIVNEIAKRYAKAKLKDASESAKAYTELGMDISECIDKQSITETPLD